MSISLYKILSDWHYKEPLTDEEQDLRETYYIKLRAFVGATARGNRRERILAKPWNTLCRHGIFDRLRIDRETQEVEYIVGQERLSEMAILRDCFD